MSRADRGSASLCKETDVWKPSRSLRFRAKPESGLWATLLRSAGFQASISFTGKEVHLSKRARKTATMQESPVWDLSICFSLFLLCVSLSL